MVISHRFFVCYRVNPSSPSFQRPSRRDDLQLLEVNLPRLIGVEEVEGLAQFTFHVLKQGGAP